MIFSSPGGCERAMSGPRPPDAHDRTHQEEQQAYAAVAPAPR